LDLRVDNVEIVGEAAIVANGGEAHGLAVSLDGIQLLAIGFGQHFMRGERRGNFVEELRYGLLERNFRLIALREGEARY
jgi:hypothetical protein